MKHFFPILIFAVSLAACNKQAVTEEQPSNSSDTVLHHVLRAIIDTNYSCLDYRDEFYALIDTMQSHVESYPDEDIRIGAKSLALDICGLFLYGDCCTPEEMRFFYDSLLLRLTAIPETWYCPSTFPEGVADWYKEPVLSQNLIFHYGDDDDVNHVICMDLYLTPDNDEAIVITLPDEAEYLASVMFHGEDMGDLDTTATFNLMKARNVLDKSEDCGQLIAFGKDFINAMLTHKGMFIAYIGDEESNDIKERFHDCHLPLSKFHEQYAVVKSQMR